MRAFAMPPCKLQNKICDTIRGPTSLSSPLVEKRTKCSELLTPLSLQALMGKLDTLEDEFHPVVIEMFREEHLPCTADIWSSINNDSFVSLTMH